MKVLLIKPRSISPIIIPPISLGYLAASLSENEYDVFIIDCALKRYTPQKLFHQVKYHKPDIIGFQIFSSELEFVKTTINKIRKIDKNVIIVGGGPHPSGVEDKIFQHIPGLNFAFAGEAEIGFPTLLKLGFVPK